MKSRSNPLLTSLYYMELEEIAEIEGLSYQRVQQIINGAVKKLARLKKWQSVLSSFRHG